jgi:hypothetical protein
MSIKLKIGVIKHVSYHWAEPKKDTSKIATREDFREMIKESLSYPAPKDATHV